MNIQSLSIVVPTKGCVNNCKFCVSKMHDNDYSATFDSIQYRKRIKYAVNNRVNTLILTGTGEALQNRSFLAKLLLVLDQENHPFPNVELQTTGILLDGELTLLKRLGVNTISLSVSDIFDSYNNWDIIGAPQKLRKDLSELTKFIKYNGFNLRLSLNMTNVYEYIPAQTIIKRCKELGADQITFRKLYASNFGPESDWVKTNAANDDVLKNLITNIINNGTKLYKLPFGAEVYSLLGMSVAVDNDCMSKEGNDLLKYVIIRENGKLYCRWDDEGSLIF